MRILILLCLLFVLPITGIQAAAIDLYSGEAVVESKETGERQRALPLALHNVLQKFSGLNSFQDYPQVEPALGLAASIQVSFHYRSVEVILADGTEGEELRLVVKFSESKVDKLAQSLQLPRWQAERDPIDVWVVVDDGLDRRIMPVEFTYVWKSMTDTAAWRGLPINWPVPDDEGQYPVDAQLLWGGYTEDLGIAQGIGAMIVAARREGAEWSVRSNVNYRGQNWTWRLTDIDLNTAMIESMQQAADVVAAANSIAASDLGTWMHRLTVAGLGNASDYSRCLAYLQHLGVVDHVSVISAQAGMVTFNLELNALPQYLEAALLEGRFLGVDEVQHNYFLLAQGSEL